MGRSAPYSLRVQCANGKILDPDHRPLDHAQLITLIRFSCNRNELGCPAPTYGWLLANTVCFLDGIHPLLWNAQL